MRFDPTFNFDTVDCFSDEYNVLWKFGELIKTLVTLASTAKKQTEIIGMGAVADEMGEEFYTFFTLSYHQYVERNLLSVVQVDSLSKLDRFLDERSGNNLPDFWDDSKLGTHPDWMLVRQQAKEILKQLEMDDLDLEFEREERYNRTLFGKKLVSQTTKTRLVRNGIR